MKTKLVEVFDGFAPWPYVTPYGNVMVRVEVPPAPKRKRRKVQLIKASKPKKEKRACPA